MEQKGGKIMDKKTIPEAIGLRIKALREKGQETQTDLAKALSCNQNNISKMEKGGSLTSDNLIAIANHYNVSLDYLCKGEGGTNLLDTLNNYIHYRIAKISGLDETSKSHLIPYIEINSSLYNCLRQIALAEQNSEMPESIRKQWINHSIENFNNGIIADNYNDFTSFIILEQSVLNENPDIIRLIEKHISEVM